MVVVTAGCSDASNSPPPVTISTPQGNITAQKSIGEPTPQKIAVVRGDALKRLEALSEQGPGFVRAYLPDVREPDLKDHDLAFRAWQTSKAPQHSNEQVVEILGGYLGNKCVVDLEMEWVTVTDEYGTDYAVRSKSAEVMAFPFSTVMKRIEAKEHDFLHGVYHTLKHTLDSGDYKTREP